MRWDDYKMGFARHAALKSKDSTRVGAAIFGPNDDIRMTGFNGPARGVADLPERRERPTKYLYASHAEQNAIDFCARYGVATEGCSIYVTHFPCSRCMTSIIQAGIVCVQAGDGQTSMKPEEFEAARIMANEAGIVICENG